LLHEYNEYKLIKYRL